MGQDARLDATGLDDLALPTEVATYASTKAGLSALRTLVSRREIMHANSPTLADQLSTCRVIEGGTGIRVVSSDPWDLVRPAAWAAAAVDRLRHGGVWVA